MYANFESVLIAVQECESDQTTLYTQRNTFGSCLYVVSSDGRFFQSSQVNHGLNYGRTVVRPSDGYINYHPSILEAENLHGKSLATMVIILWY